MNSYYVSVTGIRVNAGFAKIRFWWHAIPAMTQAKRAQGNIRVDAKIVDGVHHTVSVWKDEDSMRAYLIAGAHKKAMQAFRSIGTGSTCGFLADHVPDWDEALHYWRAHRKSV